MQPADLRIYLDDLVNHRFLVGLFMSRSAAILTDRGSAHDLSKFSEAEFDQFVANHSAFAHAAYGTPAYQAALQAIKPAIDHHYAVNAHHPEHHPNGVRDMTLFDLIEMLCDWYAAAHRTPDGTHDMVANQQRFGISPELQRILERTLDFMVRQNVLDLPPRPVTELTA